MAEAAARFQSAYLKHIFGLHCVAKKHFDMHTGGV